MPLAAAVLLTLASAQIFPPPQYSNKMQDPINWGVRKLTIRERGEIVYIQGAIEDPNGTTVTRSFHDGGSLIYVLDFCYESFDVTAEYLGSATYWFFWKSPFPMESDKNAPKAPILYGKATAMNSTGRGQLIPFLYPNAYLTNQRDTTGPQGREVSVHWTKSASFDRFQRLFTVDTAGRADVIWDPVDSSEGIGAMSQWSTTQSMYSPTGAPLVLLP